MCVFFLPYERFNKLMWLVDEVFAYRRCIHLVLSQKPLKLQDRCIQIKAKCLKNFHLMRQSFYTTHMYVLYFPCIYRRPANRADIITLNLLFITQKLLLIPLYLSLSSIFFSSPPCHLPHPSLNTIVLHRICSSDFSFPPSPSNTPQWFCRDARRLVPLQAQTYPRSVTPMTLIETRPQTTRHLYRITTMNPATRRRRRKAVIYGRVHFLARCSQQSSFSLSKVVPCGSESQLFLWRRECLMKYFV